MKAFTGHKSVTVPTRPWSQKGKSEEWEYIEMNEFLDEARSLAKIVESTGATTKVVEMEEVFTRFERLERVYKGNFGTNCFALVFFWTLIFWAQLINQPVWFLAVVVPIAGLVIFLFCKRNGGLVQEYSDTWKLIWGFVKDVKKVRVFESLLNNPEQLFEEPLIVLAKNILETAQSFELGRKESSLDELVRIGRSHQECERQLDEILLLLREKFGIAPEKRQIFAEAKVRMNR